jgi:hypothetical protein
MNMDEHEEQTTAEDFEVVNNDEPSMEEYDGIGPGPDANLIPLDEFGAPVAKVVKVRDGVRSKS